MAVDEYSDDESIDSQLEWELDQGIPQPDEPFLEKYFAGRKALIEQEKKQRHDRVFKQTMSPLARQAARIMASIRRRELKDRWTTTSEIRPAGPYSDGDTFQGMMFPLTRDQALETELWRIIERMPKGALLHAHLDGMVDIDWLVDQVLLERGMCIIAPQALDNPTNRSQGELEIKFCSDEEIKKGNTMDIWKTNYVGGTPVLVTEARKAFPDHDTTFKKWLIGRCMITPEESLRHRDGLNVIWQKFRSTFPIVDTMLFYEPIFRKSIARLLGQLATDGITYVDFRLVFRSPFFLKGKTSAETGYAKWFEVFGEELERFKASSEGAKFRGARMIWTVIRAFDNKSIAESMMECISIKKRYPQLISGFDCVGQEDTGRTLKDLTPLLFWFRKKCHEAGVEIPFFFHAGECVGDGDSTDSNLFDALLLGTRRIGHGYSLYRHPLLIDMVKEKKILVESCPISNEILRLTNSIRGHTMPALLSRGVAVSLNNDDPAILGHGKNGLSHDFWQSFMNFENLGLEGLATMAENSLRWSAVEDQRQPDWLKGINDSYMGKTIKAKLLKEWRTEFEKWCQWIIMEYPLEADDDDDYVEDEEEDDDEESEDDDEEDDD